QFSCFKRDPLAACEIDGEFLFHGLSLIVEEGKSSAASSERRASSKTVLQESRTPGAWVARSSQLIARC
ncbi:MAG TPA: hypothetical protein VFA90_15080, partial [Terriglobales bacterium]|nr:hypothetical protein [Terriglobales bacterium]